MISFYNYSLYANDYGNKYVACSMHKCMSTGLHKKKN